jgi:hypothetical protein
LLQIEKSTSQGFSIFYIDNQVFAILFERNIKLIGGKNQVG